MSNITILPLNLIKRPSLKDSAMEECRAVVNAVLHILRDLSIRTRVHRNSYAPPRSRRELKALLPTRLPLFRGGDGR